MNEINNSLIEARGPNKIKFKGKWFTSSFMILNNQVIEPWEHSEVIGFDINDFSIALKNKSELVLLGTGDLQIFPKNSVLTQLLKQGIGVEVMDTVSACRTFNVLTSEYRSPMAMLIIETNL
ncbi:MAG: Mth938-like domain-containing protein [Gammaproteobacteria bacterium]|jgi:uncharacterized protein|nr:Mth938-like domain-containing protein [Gammaproteobacteria bacterium]